MDVKACAARIATAAQGHWGRAATHRDSFVGEGVVVFLGFGLCHHMEERVINRHRTCAILALYKEVMNKEPYKDDLPGLLRGYRSAVTNHLRHSCQRYVDLA